MNLESRVVGRCQRHPKEFVVGVCAACLRERLACVDPADRHIKTSFPTDGKASNRKPIPDPKSLQKKKMVMVPEAVPASSSNGPQLRRSKSFSEGRLQARTKIDESSALEPKRKSCEIRVRNTLQALFQIDEDENPATEVVESSSSMEQNGWFKADEVVVEEHEIELRSDSVKQVTEPSKPLEPEPLRIYDSFETGESSVNAARTMKSHIDHETQNRFRVQVTENSHNASEENKKKTPNPNPNPNPITNECGDSKDKARTFWLTDMVRKRIQKWKKRNRHKHHHPQRQNLQPRDTRSEIFDDARPSCDDDPRFSIDIGRTSWEDSRHSWEEPRASWDGILIGKLVASSIVGHEEAAIGSSKNQVLAEPIKLHGDEDVNQPGGSLETRDYYSDSSLSRRRRKNMEKPKPGMDEKPKPGMDEKPKPGVDEPKSIENRNNTKVSPATLDDENNKPASAETEMEDTHGEKCSENCENPSDEVSYQKQVSKSHRWSKAWSRTITSPMWGLIQKRGSKDEGGYEGGDIEGSHSWRELQRDKEGRRGLSKGDFFSNSSIGSRSLHFSNLSNRHGVANNGSVIHRSNSNNNAQRNGSWQRKRRDEMMLDRSRSIHYSPTNVDNGLLRFYLTPLRSSRRSSTGGTRIRPPQSSSRSALGLH
jgi:hypothetical protein